MGEAEQQQQASEEISIDIEKIIKKGVSWIQKNYIIFLLLIPIFLSVFIRIQTVYLPLIDDAAENNIRSYIQASIEESVTAQYPNLPAANKQNLVQQQLQELYAKGTINYGGQEVSIDELVKENARLIKENFQDDYGLTYLGEIDPWYFYRLTENYLEHSYEGDIEINRRYYDDHQLAGTPREYLGGGTSRLPHFHVMVEVYLYKAVHLFLPNMRLMTMVYFLPVFLATLCVIPAFFLVKRVGGAIGGLAAATLVAVHPAFIGRTIAGFSDTDSYNILFPLLVMWTFIGAIEAETWKKALSLATIAGFIIGVFSFTWGGWWYIYDFLLGVCFISLWYLLVKEYTNGKERTIKIYWIIGAALLAPVFVILGLFHTIYKGIKNKEYREKTKEQHLTISTIIIFIVACALFVSLFSSFSAFISAVKEPLTFSTIKEVGIIKIWPNVLTTVAEFNPAGLSEIIGSVSFGISILLLLTLFGIGYVLFERKSLDKEQQLIISLTLVWVIGLIFLSNKIQSKIMFLVLLAVPLAYYIYKKIPVATIYFAGIGIWYAAIIKYIPFFEQHLFLFFLCLALPIFTGMIYALIYEKEIDLKYGVLLLVWFVGTIYASTKGIRFVMIMVPAFSVALGLGIAFVYKLWLDILSEKIHLKKIYIQIVLIFAIILLFVIPVTIGFQGGKNQMPLINDQWYDALKKINNEASEDAIVNSWWDFGHWFKAIADRAVTFDGGTQDTPQAHWIGKVLLTDNEKEAVAILRMLDCGGNSGYDLIYNATNDSYDSVKLTKKIIMQTKEEAVETLKEIGFSDERTEKILSLTHCNPPEDYFITSQDMVGKAPVWAHFGAWDFDKAHVINIVNTYQKEDALEKIKNDLSIDEELSLKLYTEATTIDANTWISPWPSYVSMPTRCWQEQMQLFCEAGIIINITDGDAFLQTSDGLKHPKYLLFVNPLGKFNLTDFSNYTDTLMSNEERTYSAAIIPEGEGFKGFFMDTELLQSMFTRMFFFKGHDLECFDLFDYKTTVTGEEIFVWKVDWDCTTPNIVFGQSKAINTSTIDITNDSTTNITNNTTNIKN